MSQIVDDLLLLSKADTGEIRLNREDINLNEMLNEVVAQVTILSQSKNLQIDPSFQCEEAHVYGDALRIRELFLNLIENAIKYTEEGGSICIGLWKEIPPPPSDNLLNQQEGEKIGFAKIVVSDNGIGIAREDQDKIFDRFFRVDKARSRQQGGSGLGLSICKWIVEAHQGEISVESELERGSSFTVTLPLSIP